MESGKANPREAAVLALLRSFDIDGYVVAQLRSIDGIVPTLTAIAAGEITASAMERQNAAYVLGRLGEPAAVPTLLSLLRGADQPLRLSALVALAAVELDAGARQALEAFADDQGTEPAEADYAREALKAARGHPRA